VREREIEECKKGDKNRNEMRKQGKRKRRREREKRERFIQLMLEHCGATEKEGEKESEGEK